MQPSDSTERIVEDILKLHRGRLICKLLRKEGILVQNSHILLGLADTILRSLAHHRVG
jgi:hypothetical protein